MIGVVARARTRNPIRSGQRRPKDVQFGVVCADLGTSYRGVGREDAVSQSIRDGCAAVERDRHEDDNAAATSKLATIAARVSSGPTANRLQDAIELR